MQYIEAVSSEPARFTRKVFLAGGITNCPDWQREVVGKLEDLEVTVFNPRRENFPIHDPRASEEQITWEFQKLREADVILFWFSRGSLNPIVLFELGAALERDQALVIGTDPQYERKADVHIQTALRRPSLEVVQNLDRLVAELRSLLR